jgi:hypothetical protein
MFIFLLSCLNLTSVTVEEEAPVCTNDCLDYTTSWVNDCPLGKRCLQVTNASPTEVVFVSYQVGCNGDGTPGSPQCNCTSGPTLQPGGSSYFIITNGNYTNCTPYSPLCLTEGLALMANTGAGSCSSGTRVEFTAGNAGNPYGQFDSYDIDVQPTAGGGVFYSIPVSFGPTLNCYEDVVNGDCRTLWCDSASCPDAYNTSTSGGCGSMSPQVGCQDTFRKNAGFVVKYFPSSGQSCTPASSCAE